MSSKRFEDKDPTEKIILTFDFSVDLPAGTTLSGTPTVTITTVRGTDASPGAIRNGAALFNAEATKVYIPVQAGADGCDYNISVTCPTTDPLIVLELDATLPVRS